VSGKIPAFDLGPYRIDQERHVVVDDIDDGVRRYPALLSDAGIEGADFGRAGRVLFGELPQPHRRAVKRFGRAREHVLDGHAFVDRGDEAFEFGRVAGVQPHARMHSNFAETIGLRISRFARRLSTVGQSRGIKITAMSTLHKAAT